MTNITIFLFIILLILIVVLATLISNNVINRRTQSKYGGALSLSDLQTLIDTYGDHLNTSQMNIIFEQTNLKSASDFADILVIDNQKNQKYKFISWNTNHPEKKTKEQLLPTTKFIHSWSIKKQLSELNSSDSKSLLEFKSLESIGPLRDKSRSNLLNENSILLEYPIIEDTNYLWSPNIWKNRRNANLKKLFGSIEVFIPMSEVPNYLLKSQYYYHNNNDYSEELNNANKLIGPISEESCKPNDKVENLIDLKDILTAIDFWQLPEEDYPDTIYQFIQDNQNLDYGLLHGLRSFNQKLQILAKQYRYYQISFQSDELCSGTCSEPEKIEEIITYYNPEIWKLRRNSNQTIDPFGSNLLSIRITDVPKFLHNSKLYIDNINNEYILNIPEELCKSDDKVENLKDLKDIFMAINFWQLPEEDYPYTIYEFIQANQNIQYKELYPRIHLSSESEEIFVFQPTIWKLRRYIQQETDPFGSMHLAIRINHIPELLQDSKLYRDNIDKEYILNIPECFCSIDVFDIPPEFAGIWLTNYWYRSVVQIQALDDWFQTLKYWGVNLETDHLNEYVDILIHRYIDEIINLLEYYQGKPIPSLLLDMPPNPNYWYRRVLVSPIPQSKLSFWYTRALAVKAEQEQGPPIVWVTESSSAW